MEKNKFLLPITDIFSSAAALYLSFALRFEFDIPSDHYSTFARWLPWFICIHLLTFLVGQMYSRIWRYTSLFDLYAIIGTVFTSCAINYILIFFSMGGEGYPRSVLVLFPIFLIIFSLFPRLSIRVYYSHYHEDAPFKNQIGSKSIKKRLLLIGAGKTGDKIAKEIFTSPNTNFSIIGFIDDDLRKHGARLHGKKIFCGVNEIPNLAIDYDELLITAPSASGDQMRRIVDACKKLGKRYKTVPSMTELINRKLIFLLLEM